nr:MAG TPA: hypothetical protein [Caudoviricetes sp.]
MPTAIFWTAVVSLTLSYLVQIVAVFSTLVSFFTRNHDIWCEGNKDLFDSGIQIRNVSYFLLFFIYMISTHRFNIGGTNSLEIIASIGKIYGIASSFILLLYIFLLLIRVVKKIKSPNVISLMKRIKNSVLFSIITGFVIYYLTVPVHK